MSNKTKISEDFEIVHGPQQRWELKQIDRGIPQHTPIPEKSHSLPARPEPRRIRVVHSSVPESGCIAAGERRKGKKIYGPLLISEPGHKPTYEKAKPVGSKAINRRTIKHGRTRNAHHLNVQVMHVMDKANGLTPDCGMEKAERLHLKEQERMAAIKAHAKNRHVVGVRTGKTLFTGTLKECNIWIVAHDMVDRAFVEPLKVVGTLVI